MCLEIAQAVGVSAFTVRRWTKIGLLPQPETRPFGAARRMAFWPDGTSRRAQWLRRMFNDLRLTQAQLEKLIPHWLGEPAGRLPLAEETQRLESATATLRSVHDLRELLYL